VSTVDELINPVTSSWDVDLVKAIFWPVDARRILQIPIGYGREDLVAWHFNRSGQFSVRSAYHCQWNSKFGNRFNQTQADTTSWKQLWKNLWNLKVSGKIKIFGWWALKGFVPGRAVINDGEQTTTSKGIKPQETRDLTWKTPSTREGKTTGARQQQFTMSGVWLQRQRRRLTTRE
jgi:hypothetical protein